MFLKHQMSVADQYACLFTCFRTKATLLWCKNAGVGYLPNIKFKPTWATVFRVCVELPYRFLLMLRNP